MLNTFFKSFFFQFWVGVLIVAIVVKIINGDNTDFILGVIFITGGILHAAITDKKRI